MRDDNAVAEPDHGSFTKRLADTAPRRGVADSHTYPNAHGPDAVTHAYPNAHGSDADTHSYTYTDGHPNGYTYSDSDSLSHGLGWRRLGDGHGNTWQPAPHRRLGRRLQRVERRPHRADDAWRTGGHRFGRRLGLRTGNQQGITGQSKPWSER